MSLLFRSRVLVNFAISSFPTAVLKKFDVRAIPQRIFSTLSIPRYGDKFSIGARKRKSRKNPSPVRKPSWKQSEVFQLDPLTGEDAPYIPDTIKQHAVADTLLGVVQDVLNGPELNPVLSPVIGDYQVEVAQVKVTRDINSAVIFWTIPDKLKGSEGKVQNLLTENRDHIRRLLPAYSSLVRFPQLAFIQDKKADYEEEVESLLQEAKNSNGHSRDVKL